MLKNTKYFLFAFAGIGLLVLAQPSAMATNVSGNISGSVTWSPGGNPYTVVGDITVLTGARLSIEAGVTVEFDSGMSMTVYGTLEAVGSGGAPIRFTSSSPTTEPYFWGGVRLVNSSLSRIETCSFEYGSEVLVLSNSPIKVRNCGFFRNWRGVVLDMSNLVSIEGNSFSRNGTCVYLKHSSGAGFNALITGNTMERNQVGVWLDDYSISAVQNNTIASSELVGIRVYSGSVAKVSYNDLLFNSVGISLSKSTCEVSYNNIMSTETTAIAIYDPETVFPTTFLIDHNRVFDNKGNVIFAGYTSNTALTVTNNEIHSRNMYGIGLSHGLSMTLRVTDNTFTRSSLSIANTNYTNNNLLGDNSIIERNVILGPGSSGIGVYFGFDSCAFRLNTVIGWGKAVDFGYMNGQVGLCDLSGNIVGVDAGPIQLPNSVDARNNWWGSATGPGTVGPGAGSRVSNGVIYEPWLQAPFSYYSAEAVYSIKLFSDKSYISQLLSSDNVGILDRLFISVEAGTGSPEAKNWTGVKVTTGAYPAGVVLVLTETASNSGIYNGEVRLDGTSSSISDALIKAAVSNTVRVSSMLDPLVTAEVGVSRTARWKRANSPEIIPSGLDLKLLSGSTLEIEAGVTVESIGNTLVIEGKLLASGEASAQIIFTSAAANPVKGNWGGVKLSGVGAKGSVMDHCSIKYAAKGVFVSATMATISNCRFDNNLYGIYLQSNTDPINILANEFTGNGTTGQTGAIFCYISGAWIRGNTFINNVNGVFSWGGAGYPVPDVRFNNFLGNIDYGVFNYTEPYPFNAQSNWWGTSEGADVVDTRVTPPEPDDGSGDRASAFIYLEPHLLEGPVRYSPPTAISSVAATKGSGILERVFIKVVGTDSSTESVNWTTVRITSESEPAGIYLDLIETGMATGTFEGEGRVVYTANSSSDAFGHVRAVVGNTVTVASGQDPSKFSVRAIGSVGTWEAALSPEILNRNIIFLLPTGSVLRVEPGVTVEFEDLSGLSIAVTRLYAVGLPSSRITFTSRKKTPIPGSWKYIQMGPGGSYAEFENCDIYYGGSAYAPLYIDGSSSLVRNCNIKYSGQHGIYCTGGPANPIIEGNDISENLSSGIYSNLGTIYPTVRNNRIANNGRGGNAGIYINNNNFATIEGNTISSNEPYGIYSSGATNSKILIRGNTIEAGPNSSVRYCIYARYCDPLVRFNNLIGNDADDFGVYMETKLPGPTPAVDASLNYWENALAGDFVISNPSVPGRLAWSPPSFVGAVKFYKDRSFSSVTGGLGILDRVFVSAEGADSDTSHYNWTTVAISNETSPTNIIYVDLLETGSNNSGKFGGVARIGSANDDWVDMIGSSVGNSLKAYSQVGGSVSAPLTVLSLATWEAADNPERILNYSTLALPAGSILRIDPGVSVEAGNNVIINISGTLEARGQKLNRIIFAPMNPNPATGNWQAISFLSGGKGTIAYSTVKYATSGIKITASSPMIAMVSMESCSSLEISGSASPRVVDCDLVNNTGGVRVYSYTGAAKVNYNNLINANHNMFGVNNTSPVSIDATNNWWDAMSGPGPIGTGSGVKVTNYVKYQPYLGSRNIPGGPIASNPTPETGTPTNDASVKIWSTVFDPEDVDPATISVEVDGTVVSSGDARLAYSPTNYQLIFSPSPAFAEGVHTFEVIAARDTFGETLRAPLTTEFIVDLTSPEITSVAASPYFATRGYVLVTLEVSDNLAGIDYTVSPSIEVKYSEGGVSAFAQKLSYAGSTWTGRLNVNLTLGSSAENGPATIEITAGAKDLAGNRGGPSLEAAHLFIDTVSPEVTVTSPPAGITLEGPATYTISWEGASDPDPSSGLKTSPVSIYLMAGNSQYLITGEYPDTGQYLWSIPPISSGNCRIRVQVKDKAGNIGAATSGLFAIDTINPFIVSTDPANGETNVPLTRAITVNFSKPMSIEGVENAFSSAPYLVGTFEWTAGDATLIFHPDIPLNYATTYEVTIQAGTTDKFLHVLLDSPYPFSFMTVLPESAKPVISQVRFDGRAYRDNDVISSTPLISAVVLDDQGGSGVEKAGITIKLGSYTVHPDTYDVATGEAKVRLSQYPLGRGTYTVSIEAVDRAGNPALPFSGTVRVMYGDVQMVGPVLSWPSPFRPMHGDIATLAYTLSTDADITVYMYDTGGRVVLTKKFGAAVPGGRAGYNSFSWNGRSDMGGIIGNGIYVYKITSGKRIIGTGKLVVYD